MSSVKSSAWCQKRTLTFVGPKASLKQFSEVPLVSLCLLRTTSPLFYIQHFQHFNLLSLAHSTLSHSELQLSISSLFLQTFEWTESIDHNFMSEKKFKIRLPGFETWIWGVKTIVLGVVQRGLVWRCFGPWGSGNCGGFAWWAPTVGGCLGSQS